MGSNLLSVEQIVTIIDTKINGKKGYQSNVDFYKISQKHIDVIKNEIDIDFDTDIIVKKQYKYAGGLPTIKMGGKIGQYNREKEALLKLQKDFHFPTILCADDDSTTIYMSYCGNPIHKKDVPNNWKEQIREILLTLQKNKIYNNDTLTQNYVIKDAIIYLIDFGWASFDNDDFPYINITEKDLEEYNDLLELSNIAFKRVAKRHLEFVNKCKKSDQQL